MQKDKGFISKKTLVIIIPILFLAVSGVYFSKARASENNNEVTRLREYTVTRGNIRSGTNGSGIIKLKEIKKSFENEVIIEELYANEGQKVKKGDKLAKISMDAIEEKLAEQRSNLEKANISLEQAKNAKVLIGLNNNSDSEVNKNQYEVSRNDIVSRINNIEKSLNDCENKISTSENELKNLLSNEGENKEKIENTRLTINSLKEEKKGLENQLEGERNNLNTLDANRGTQIADEQKREAINNEKNNIAIKDADNNIRLAELEVEKIYKEINKLEKLKVEPIIYAEETGIVMAVGALNTVIMPNDPVVTLGSLEKTEAEITISQGDISKIEEGQNVSLELSAYEDEEFKGKIKLINLKPNTEGGSTSYKVIVEVDSKGFDLLEGMTANAEFILKEVTDVLMLSNKAITLKDGNQVVKVKDLEGNLKEVQIVTGFSDGRNSEVVSGLNEGDVVVIGG
ncbi:efflux RND transporter periplasmic adaptor subunit [Clostridium sp.]|uniref:efflux RND transporter periplasmic adaptor subunit n=1 Tax=Clostridium sp. TaxID=1506 RepID=UPI003F3EAC8F